ncbi:MAG: transcription factor TFIIIC [Infirmifilum sp.]
MRNDAKELRLSEGGGEQIERRVLEIVAAAGEAGIMQREIWQLLNIDSRKGSRIIMRLERAGLVSRETIVHRGRKVYLLKPTPKLRNMPKLPDTLDDVPCFYCPLLLSCGELAKILNCERMERWLLDSSIAPS